MTLCLGDWVKVSAKGEFTYAITALVVWVRMGESDHSTVAGLELF
jgi:hypothetical protein